MGLGFPLQRPEGSFGGFELATRGSVPQRRTALTARSAPPSAPQGSAVAGPEAARRKMAAAGAGSGRAAVSRSRPPPARFRGCLAGALLGDCLGAVFEGRSVVKLPDLLSFLRGLEPPGGDGEPAGSARRGGRNGAGWGGPGRDVNRRCPTERSVTGGGAGGERESLGDGAVVGGRFWG